VGAGSRFALPHLRLWVPRTRVIGTSPRRSSAFPFSPSRVSIFGKELFRDDRELVIGEVIHWTCLLNVLRHQGDEGLHDHIWLLLHHVIEDFLAVLVDEALQEIECLLIYPVS
jgi:hypothetical protein